MKMKIIWGEIIWNRDICFFSKVFGRTSLARLLELSRMDTGNTHQELFILLKNESDNYNNPITLQEKVFVLYKDVDKNMKRSLDHIEEKFSNEKNVWTNDTPADGLFPFYSNRAYILRKSIIDSTRPRWPNPPPPNSLGIFLHWSWVCPLNFLTVHNLVLHDQTNFESWLGIIMFDQ